MQIIIVWLECKVEGDLTDTLGGHVRDGTEANSLHFVLNAMNNFQPVQF